MNAMAEGHSQMGGAQSAGGGLKRLAWLGGALATLAAAAVGAVLAVVFAATVLVIGLMAAAVVALASLALRARKSSRSPDPQIIEAHKVGGHSWVAYGWDRRPR